MPSRTKTQQREHSTETRAAVVALHFRTSDKQSVSYGKIAEMLGMKKPSVQKIVQHALKTAEENRAAGITLYPTPETLQDKLGTVTNFTTYARQLVI